MGQEGIRPQYAGMGQARRQTEGQYQKQTEGEVKSWVSQVWEVYWYKFIRSFTAIVNLISPGMTLGIPFLCRVPAPPRLRVAK